MIQRIQTVYLLLILGLMATTLFLQGTLKIELVENSIVAVLALIAIFLFKKRKKQINVCWAILLILALSYLNLLNESVVFKATNVFPAIAIVLDILAIRAIYKDEKLVRSLDRLR